MRTSPLDHPWASLEPKRRVEHIARWRKLVARDEADLCRLMEREVDKPRHEALLSDLLPFLSACRWLEKRAPAILRTRSVDGAPGWMRGVSIVERREPVGRVGIIATWNYPVQLLGIQVAQALAAGNLVIVKPSERAERTQERLLMLAIEAGLPEGVLTWVDARREAGRDLIEAGGLDHVIFTGSTEVGRKVAATLAETLTPATLELSGRDSAFVLEDARPGFAAASLWGAMTVNAGQTCMGPRRALVHRDVYEEFSAAIERHAARATPRMLIDDAAAKRCYELAADAVKRGGRDAAGHVDPPSGRLFRPSVILDCPPVAPLVQGAHFGPVLAVVPVDDFAAALDIHRSCDQHLTASMFTADPARATRLSRRLGVTNLTINDAIVPQGHPGVSIGGRGPSGSGLSRGTEGLLGLTRPVYVSTGPGAARRMIKPPPRTLVRMVAAGVRWWYGRGADASKPIPRAKPGRPGEPPIGIDGLPTGLTRSAENEPGERLADRAGIGPAGSPKNGQVQERTGADAPGSRR